MNAHGFRPCFHGTAGNSDLQSANTVAVRIIGGGNFKGTAGNRAGAGRQDTIFGACDGSAAGDSQVPVRVDGRAFIGSADRRIIQRRGMIGRVVFRFSAVTEDIVPVVFGNPFAAHPYGVERSRRRNQNIFGHGCSV